MDEFVYSTQKVAVSLNIGRSTVNKYARSLEEAGYIFIKDGKEHRAFTEHDIITFRALTELLSRGVEYDRAINTIAERYKKSLQSDSVAVLATQNSSHDIAILNSRVEELISAVSMLSARLDQTIDERVKSEVSIVKDQLGQQINEVFLEVKTIQEETNQKLEEVISRIDTHGKRKKLFGIF